MAGKSTGMGARVGVGGYDVGGSTNSLSRISGGPSPIDLTDVTQSAFERKGGKRDGGMTIVSYYNTDAGASHAVYSPLPTADALFTYTNGSSIGSPVANVIGKQIGYDGSRGDDGSYLLTVDAQANGYGLSWGRLATAWTRIDSAATAAAAVSPLDLGSASPGAFGLVMFVHLFAFTGTSVTIKLQESSDNGADAYADVVGGTTGALVAARQGIRIATGLINVERYLKVITTGTFSNAEFAVSVFRHPVQVDY
jgi:hypothetical protein